MTRFDILEWLLPYCEPDALCVQNSKMHGWIRSATEVRRCIEAWREGNLAELTVTVVHGRNHETYGLRGCYRIGLVLHRNRQVARFAIDYDCKEKSNSLHRKEAIERWLQSKGVVFTSKSGRGYHVFYALRNPITIESFLVWAKSWKFNRPGEPECFPKSDGLSQLWLPNHPNELGGDQYCEGDFESATLDSLPSTLPRSVSSESVDFLRGLCEPGRRNEALNKAAYELSASGMPEDEIYSLCLRASELCGLLSEEPNKTKNTIERAIRDGRQKGKKKTAALIPTTEGEEKVWFANELGLAERFLDFAAGKIFYCADVEEWAYWNGRHWDLGHCGELGALNEIRLFAHALQKQALQSSNESERELLSDFAFRIGSGNFAERALRWARNDEKIRVPFGRFDAQPHLVNFRNGTFDLKTGKLREHSRADFLTFCLDYDLDLDAEAPRWADFLDLITGSNTELQTYFQVCAGCCLYGATHERAAFFMLGEGNNGKTVFQTTLFHVLGAYAKVVDTDVLLSAFTSESRYSTALLRGKRFVVASESNESERMNEKLFKRFSGGDILLGRALYQQEKEVMPQFKLYLATNHPPVVEDQSEAIWNRIYLMPFWYQIPEDRKRDQETVLNELRAEAQGIMLWLIDGYRLFQDSGRRILVPAKVQKEKQKWRISNDAIWEFIQSRIDFDPAACTAWDEIYDAYHAFWSKYLQRQNVRLVARNRFTETMMRTLMRHGIGKDQVYTRRYEPGVFWHGIKLRSSLGSWEDGTAVQTEADL